MARLSLLLVVLVSFFIPKAGAAGDEPIPAAIPPGELAAKAALETSPRHHEWLNVALPGSERKIGVFVAYPERKDQAPVVLVIHEIYGLTDWIRAPVLGLYGEDDARVNATVGPAAEKMKELGKPFTAETYPGAGHGFLRAQEARDGANLAAARKAWPATVAHLKRNLE